MRRTISGLVLACCLAGQANAATISYSLENTGGITYQADFSITNDTLAFSIDEFTIFFAVGQFENISSISSPIDWDPLIIEPNTFIPDDGFADWLALSSSISVGETLSGFVVSFDYLGAGIPESLPFDIVDPITFNSIDSGLATITTVPVPPAIWLFGSGLTLLLVRLRDVGKQQLRT